MFCWVTNFLDLLQKRLKGKIKNVVSFKRLEKWKPETLVCWPQKCKQQLGRWQDSPSIGRPTWNGPEKSCKVGYRKISQHIKCDRYATQAVLEDSQRCVDSRLCVFYKIRNNLVAIEKDNYKKNLQRGTGRRSHQLRQIRADRDYTHFSFFPQTIVQWNQRSVRHVRQLR